MTERVVMKPKQGDRSVTFANEWGDSAKVRAWTNSGVLVIEVMFEEDSAVEVEINGKGVK